MKDYIADRVCDIADHMLESKCTVRSAATRFGVSKLTVALATNTEDASNGEFSVSFALSSLKGE